MTHAGDAPVRGDDGRCYRVQIRKSGEVVVAPESPDGRGRMRLMRKALQETMMTRAGRASLSTRALTGGARGGSRSDTATGATAAAAEEKGDAAAHLDKAGHGRKGGNRVLIGGVSGGRVYKPGQTGQVGFGLGGTKPVQIQNSNLNLK